MSKRRRQEKARRKREDRVHARKMERRKRLREKTAQERELDRLEHMCRPRLEPIVNFVCDGEQV